MSPIFLDPSFGTPLSLYIHQDVHDRDALVDLVVKHGGQISPAYSGVSYILVDPHKPTGQSLFHQYVNKKGRVVLDARWIHECIKASQLQTFQTDWAGCKVDGTEAAEVAAPASASRAQPLEQQQHTQPEDQQHYAYYSQWPEQTHYREEWNQYQFPAPVNPAAAQYDHNGHPWAAPGSAYYNPPYVQSYQPPAYIQDDNESNTTPEPGPSTLPTESPEKPRGRKRGRATPAPPASALVTNRNPRARSPAPPTRVVKSTYGGNLFTADDVLYLKNYIDYCHDQGLVLSLREICERIAVKAPHHTFYSWRRYCNKHQIRLGGYAMNVDSSASPNVEADDEDETVPPPTSISSRAPGGSIHRLAVPAETGLRSRSPTPPRALFRSTTGKGNAFTDADIMFLVRFLEYRKSQGKVDMVTFWKDVATRAPHHSRASWMKFWRRHKHELEHDDTADEPLPDPPDKKRRYSRGDDILLARYFHSKVEGTSDKIFQAFARLHPHHPWKGWQEHHRIHKVKIDHFIQRLANGETLEEEDET